MWDYPLASLISVNVVTLHRNCHLIHSPRKTWPVFLRDREKDRQTDRQTDRERERERERELEPGSGLRMIRMARRRCCTQSSVHCTSCFMITSTQIPQEMPRRHLNFFRFSSDLEIMKRNSRCSFGVSLKIWSECVSKV